MNRNLLLIAIAAIAVVGIAVGLFLAGAGQTGPLSGSAGPIPTSINLSVSNCSPPDYAGLVSYTVTGYLVDAGGAPVANRTVELVTESCRNGACSAFVESLVTRTDGAFGTRKRGPPTGNSTDTWERYHARFAGDSQYLQSTSNQVDRPC